MSTPVAKNSPPEGVTKLERIKPAEIPIFSEKAREIFEEILKTVFPDEEVLNTLFPNSMYGEYSLGNRARKLAMRFKQNTKDLKHLREHPTRHKIIAVLRTTLAIAIIVGGILGTTVVAMAGSAPLALAVASVACIAYIVLCYYNVHCIRGSRDFTHALIRPHLPLDEHAILEETRARLIKNRTAILENVAQLAEFFRQNRRELGLLQDRLRSQQNWLKEEIEQKYSTYSAQELGQASDQLNHAITFYDSLGQMRPKPAQ